jgi:hypothetical protein
MANTERLKALQMVSTARKAVGEEKEKDGLTDSQQKLLDDVYSQLEDMEDTLVHEDIQDSIKNLQDAENALASLVGRMKRSTDTIRELSKTVDTAATAIGALAQIVTTAISAGLV